MPRGQCKRGQWSLDSLQAAVRDVLMYGKSERMTSIKFGVPRQTLRRHIIKVKNGEGVSKRLGTKTVLSEDQEEELVSLILYFEERLFGCTRPDVRSLVYQFCEVNGITHPFNKENKVAGVKWLRAFMARHPILAVRIPEQMSFARAFGFTKVKVDEYMNLLKQILFDEEGNQVIPPSQIYNVDETGYSICHKPNKILARKGKKDVHTLTIAERGKTITAIICASATGQFLTPMLIFPRVRMRKELIPLPNGSVVGEASPSGWVNEDLFYKWFEDIFIQSVQPRARKEKTLLILDGHSSHTKNIRLINTAKENNVIIVSLPPHTTHRLQPLDVSVFKSLNSAYNKEVQNWLREHPGQRLTEWDVAPLFYTSFKRAAGVENATNGFRKCGIHPFSPESVAKLVEKTELPLQREICDTNLPEAAPETEANTNPPVSANSLPQEPNLLAAATPHPQDITPPVPATPQQQDINPPVSTAPHPQDTNPPVSATPQPQDSNPPVSATPQPQDTNPPVSATPQPQDSNPPVSATPQPQDSNPPVSATPQPQDINPPVSTAPQPQDTNPPVSATPQPQDSNPPVSPAQGRTQDFRRGGGGRDPPKKLTSQTSARLS